MSKVLTRARKRHSLSALALAPRMNSLTRLIGYSVLLLFVFLAAALGAQSWLRQQTQRLRAEAIEDRRTQFIAAAAALTSSGQDRRPDLEDRLGAVIGGRVFLYGDRVPAPAADPAILYFDQKISDAPRATTARVTFPAPPTNRLLATYQRVTVGLLVFGVALLLTGAFLAVLTGRGTEPHSPAPRDASLADIGSLAHLAKTSVAQSAALDHERDFRRLAEEDALLKQQLLNQSLEGKIRLGHDLHDGIIQSLYASGLTIESARSVIKSDPDDADRRLGQCVQNLNATIRDVRTYITGLAPENLRLAGFTQAIQSLTNELRAGRPLDLELKIDDEATALLTQDQSLEVLQVAREAISNSLRHGGASLLTVRLHQSDREVCLLVQDNGAGFDPARRDRPGLGLGNMQTRAGRIGASLRIESQPDGTRVILTLPLLQTT